MTATAKVHPLLTVQIANGRILSEQIEAVAAHLAQLLHNMHGDEWSIDIDHDAGYVAVSRNFVTASDRPNYRHK